MIALFNFVPKTCPNCGEEFRGFNDMLGRQDYFAGCAQTCPGCQLSFAYADSDHLIDAARESGGDLAMYASD